MYSPPPHMHVSSSCLPWCYLPLPPPLPPATLPCVGTHAPGVFDVSFLLNRTDDACRHAKDRQTDTRLSPFQSGQTHMPKTDRQTRNPLPPAYLRPLQTTKQLKTLCLSLHPSALPSSLPSFLPPFLPLLLPSSVLSPSYFLFSADSLRWWP